MVLIGKYICQQPIAGKDTQRPILGFLGLGPGGVEEERSPGKESVEEKDPPYWRRVWTEQRESAME